MTTTVVIGIIAIVVAFALLIVLCFRGMSAMYVAPLCALVVAVACGLPWWIPWSTPLPAEPADSSSGCCRCS